MKTDAQRRARDKYREKITRVYVEFYPTEVDLLEHLEQQETKAGYIKELIRRDMVAKNKGDK